LAALVAAAQQKQQGLATPREIDAVPRAMIDPQHMDATTNGFRIPEQSDLNPGDTSLYRLDSDRVSQSVEPVSKLLGLADFQSRDKHSGPLQFVNFSYHGQPKCRRFDALPVARGSSMRRGRVDGWVARRSALFEK
jgi:hypothetical protein